MPLRQRRRRARSAPAVVAVPALLAVLGAGAPPVSTVADLRIRPVQAIAGETVRFDVTLSPETSRPVVLQRRSRDRWVQVTTARTDAAGSAVLTRAAPGSSTTYRVRAPRFSSGATTYAADVSPARTLTAQRQDVFLRLPASAAEGSSVTAFVECFPHRPGREVVLRQRPAGGAWQTVASGTQGERGMLVLEALAPEEGVHELRARILPAGGAAATLSDTHRLTVTPAD